MSNDSNRHIKKVEPRIGRAWACLGICILFFAATVWICADHLFGGAVHKMLTGRDSSDVRTVTVPALVGTSFIDGKSADPALFDVSVVYVYAAPDENALRGEAPVGAPASAPAGTPTRQIMAQEPPAGARRKVIPGKQKCALRLTVCLGEQVLNLPDMAGKEGREAKIALQNEGFSPILVYCRPDEVPSASQLPASYATSRAAADGEVLYTDPAPGTRLPAGATVRIYVAERGVAPSVLCPDLTGLTLPQAVATLEAAGLSLGSVTTVVLPDTPATPDGTEIDSTDSDTPAPMSPWPPDIFHSETPDEMPGQMPDEIPDGTPGEAPGETPGETPGEKPGGTPEILFPTIPTVVSQDRLPDTWLPHGTTVDLTVTSRLSPWM